MNVEDRIKKAHLAISRDEIWCSYAVVLACGDTIVTTERGPTACTDGWTKWYNPDFAATLSDAELRLLVLHENSHVAFQHLKVWKNLSHENPRLANVAMDHFVNLSLIDSDKGRGFIRMPAKGIQPDERFRGMNVKQIYDILKQEMEDESGGDEGEDENDGVGGTPGDGGEPGNGKGNGKSKGGFDDHDWDGSGNRTAEEIERHRKEIEQAIRQGEALSRMRGRGKGSSNGMFGDLLEPKVNWKDLLREFIITNCGGTDESSWRRPNRRHLIDDVYLPSMAGTTFDTLLIGFDTSGSCFGSDDMTLFVTELTSAIEQVRPSKIHVVYCDYDVTGHQEFDEGQFAVHNLKPVGGGGTDLTNIFSYAKEKNLNPTACIVFTDGYTPFGEQQPYPTLWAINTHVQSTWGTTIRIGE